MFPDKFNLPGSNLENGVAPMPNRYALEMIADWHGASYTYTGSWDCSDWLFENMPRITVHSETAAYLREQLTNLGYPKNVVEKEFAHEAW